MYGYIYLTTNLVNNKKYIGKHKASKFDSDYKGSGKALKRAIKKYSSDNFKVELLEKCYSEDILNNKEKYYIEKFNAVESRNFYNMKDGGDGGFPPHSGKNHPMYGKRGKDNPNYGKKHIKPHGPNKLISESKLGKKWYNDGNKNYFIYPKDKTDNLIEGMLPKAYKSKDSLKKHSETLTGRIAINNGKVTKMINPDDLEYYKSKGWKKGSYKQYSTGMLGKHHSQEFKDKVSKNTRGRIWVNNGSINKRVKPEELQDYLNNNFVKGKISKKCNDHRNHS